MAVIFLSTCHNAWPPAPVQNCVDCRACAIPLYMAWARMAREHARRLQMVWLIRGTLGFEGMTAIPNASGKFDLLKLQKQPQRRLRRLDCSAFAFRTGTLRCVSVGASRVPRMQ